MNFRAIKNQRKCTGTKLKNYRNVFLGFHNINFHFYSKKRCLIVVLNFQLVPSAISGMTAYLGATATTEKYAAVEIVLVLQDVNLVGWEDGANSEVGFNHQIGMKCL